MTQDPKRDEYDSIDALNWSTLKEIAVSPAWMHHRANHPDECGDKPHYRRGRAIHVATLERDEFESRYVIQPDFGPMQSSTNRKARDAWKETVGDEIEIITQEERDNALRCADAIWSHPVARDYLADASFEHTLQWKLHGVACKGRVDAAAGRIVDLKSTRHFSVSAILRDAANYGYHGQVTWYHRGAYLNGMVKPNSLPAMICVSQIPSSTFVDVTVIDMANHKDVFESGVAYYERLLNLYIGCRATDMWPGMAPEVVPWTLPSWEMEDK